MIPLYVLGMKFIKKLLFLIFLIVLLYAFRGRLLTLKEPAINFIREKTKILTEKAKEFMEETPELAPITNVEDDLQDVLDNAGSIIDK
jgi:Na+-transporting methylmalonyl-CoA/oxaloacetate decarboxylase gamma subunit